MQGILASVGVGRQVSAASRRTSQIRLIAVCGFAGTMLLVAYFGAPAVLNWPYGGASPSEVSAYALSHTDLFYAGAWLQGSGTLLSVIFLVSVARLTAEGTLVNTLVTVFATSLLAIVLVEGALLVAVPVTASTGDTTGAATTFALSNGVFVRVFAIAPASATYVAVGLALARTEAFRPLGLTAIAIGAIFEIAGIAAIFIFAAAIVLAVLGAAQALWIAAAALNLWRKAEFV